MCLRVCMRLFITRSWQTPGEEVSMNQYGRGTLTPSDDPALSKQHLSQQQLDTAAETARLRGIGSNLPQPGRPVRTQASERSSSLQLKAHQRLAERSSQKLSPVSSKQPHVPSTLASHKSAVAAKLLKKQTAAQEQYTEEAAAATSAVRQMENRIATDLTRAIECTIGTKCLEHNLIDAENSADRFFRKSVASTSQHTTKASVLHNLGNKLTKSGSTQPDALIAQSSPIYLNPAASNNFWKEAAEITEKSPGDTKRKTTNSANTFVKQMAAASRDTAHATAPVAPPVMIGPMTSTKSKIFQ